MGRTTSVVVIKDVVIAQCICGIDKGSSMRRMARQRVITWLLTAGGIGLLAVLVIDGLSLQEWRDPRSFLALGILAYCIGGILARMYIRLKQKPKHSFGCSLRRSFYDVV